MKTVADVVAWRLCTGCGACASICPEGKIHLADFVDDGIRPVLKSGSCGSCEDCLKVCPGYKTAPVSFPGNGDSIPELKEGWGQILEIWEGYAEHPALRYHGSSGGLISALSLYCIEKKKMEGVLHIGADEEKPFINKTVFSHTLSDLLSRTGSRYAPASPCEGLNRIESASDSCLFIGKPCDVAGLKKAQILRPSLEKKVGLAIGIFCAGTPSTKGILDLLSRLNVEPGKIENVRYRGRGWPGRFQVELKDGQVKEKSYAESWGFVERYRPYRCYLCPDGTSQFADISCGDPWYRAIKEGEPGYSLVLIRTEKGRKIFQEAREAGYLSADQVSAEVLIKSQKEMLAKKGAVWGRLFAMTVCRIPTPGYRGFSLFKNWCGLTPQEKSRSIFGTIYRVVQRKYFRPMNLGRMKTS
jgi:coenzyme F420 hydrogenase subunit beta